MVDDVLDATGTDEQLGKPAGSDVAHDKRTFVTVLGIERARELAEDSERRCAELLDALPGAAGVPRRAGRARVRARPLTRAVRVDRVTRPRRTL